MAREAEIDAKARHAIPFILSRLDAHRQSHEHSSGNHALFILGFNGVQGAGKTTLVNAITSTLEGPEHGVATLAVSLDDFYLSRAQQVALTAAHPDNPLLAQRGEPGTHDLALLKSFVAQLARGDADVRVPSYDKGACNGKGDRKPEENWKTVNAGGQHRVQVLLLEGWCIGFRPLSDADLETKWKRAVDALAQDQSTREDSSMAPETSESDELHAMQANGRLGAQKLEHLRVVNKSLREYDEITDQFDAFIHIDAGNTQWVYDWRLQPERRRRRERGQGMSDKEVIAFVNGYYPAYELYTDTLRSGIFAQAGRQLRMRVARDRSLQDATVI